MVGAFLFAGLALATVMLIYLAIRNLMPVHISLGLDAIYVLVLSLVLAEQLLFAVRYAKRNMGAPDAVWLAIAFFAVATWAIAIPFAHGGFYAPLRPPIVMTLGLALGWFLERRVP
jgi:uncharacterized membrane protein